MIKYNSRLISLDLLKIYAMFLIVVQYLLDFIGTLTIAKFNIKYLSVYFFESFSIVAVDVFVLITGFFLIKKEFKWQKAFSLIFEVVAFSWIILLLFKLFGIRNLAPNSVTDYIFPIFSGLYWFISSYVVLYLLFPFINKFIYALNDKQLKIFAILILILANLWKYDFNCKSVFWLIVVYFWGACIRIFIEERKQTFLFLTDKSVYNILLYVLFSLVSMVSYIYLNIHEKAFVDLLVFNNFFVFLSALFLFLFVVKIKFSNNLFSKIIVFIAPASIGVYLIHMHPLVLYYILNLLQTISPPYSQLSLNILFFSLLIFIICFGISLIFHKILMFVSYKIILPNIEVVYNNIKRYLTKK